MHTTVVTMVIESHFIQSERHLICIAPRVSLTYTIFSTILPDTPEEALGQSGDLFITTSMLFYKVHTFLGFCFYFYVNINLKQYNRSNQWMFVEGDMRTPIDFIRGKKLPLNKSLFMLLTIVLVL